MRIRHSPLIEASVVARFAGQPPECLPRAFEVAENAPRKPAAAGPAARSEA